MKKQKNKTESRTDSIQNSIFKEVLYVHPSPLSYPYRKFSNNGTYSIKRSQTLQGPIPFIIKNNIEFE